MVIVIVLTSGPLKPFIYQLAALHNCIVSICDVTCNVRQQQLTGHQLDEDAGADLCPAPLVVLVIQQELS